MARCSRVRRLRGHSSTLLRRARFALGPARCARPARYVVSSRWWRRWTKHVGFGQVADADADANAAEPRSPPGPSVRCLSGGAACSRPRGPLPGQRTDGTRRRPSASAGPIDSADVLVTGAELAARRSPVADSAANPAEDGHARQLRPGVRRGRDVVVMGEGAWEQLYGWYGGGPPVRRKVECVDDRLQVRTDRFSARLSCHRQHRALCVSVRVALLLLYLAAKRRWTCIRSCATYFLMTAA